MPDIERLSWTEVHILSRSDDAMTASTAAIELMRRQSRKGTLVAWLALAISILSLSSNLLTKLTGVEERSERPGHLAHSTDAGRPTQRDATNDNTAAGRLVAEPSIRSAERARVPKQGVATSLPSSTE